MRPTVAGSRASSFCFPEFPERGQVHDVFFQIGGFGCFQATWKLMETLISDNVPKAFISNVPLADVGVAIDARAEPCLRIIEVKGENLFEAHSGREFVDCLVPAFRRADVIPSGE